MARRYRYAFARQREAEDGIISTGLAIACVVLFVIAVMLSCFLGGEGIIGTIMGGLGVCGILLACYGFILGLKSLKQKGRSHTYSTAGAIANGIIMIGWLCLYLVGV